MSKKPTKKDMDRAFLRVIEKEKREGKPDMIMVKGGGKGKGRLDPNKSYYLHSDGTIEVVDIIGRSITEFEERKLEEIKTRLSRISPGTWQRDSLGTISNDTNPDPICMKVVRKEDAEFIIRAAQDIRILLSIMGVWDFPVPEELVDEEDA